MMPNIPVDGIVVGGRLFPAAVNPPAWFPSFWVLTVPKNNEFIPEKLAGAQPRVDVPIQPEKLLGVQFPVSVPFPPPPLPKLHGAP